MRIGPHTIGICSWSLRCKDYAEMAGLLRTLELSHVQLHLSPLVALSPSERAERVKLLTDAGVIFTAGMVSFPGENYSTISHIRSTGGFVPDAEWPSRREHAIAGARIASELGIKQLSTHVGFVPASSASNYRPIVDRIADVAKEFAKLGVSLTMETGQERARELLQFLNDLNQPNVGINFDPANMILYGAGDPIEAIQTLDGHIRHVHVKDAISSAQPGTAWGSEVPFGKGQVDPEAFLTALAGIAYTGPLVIEREAGNNRTADVQFAIDSLRKAADRV